MPTYAQVKGGIKLIRYLRQKRRQVERVVSQRTFDVGFNDPSISGLAAIHEFGKGDIPERPAFRASKPAVRSSVQLHARRIGRTVARPESRSDQIESAIQGTAKAAEDAIKASYLRFRGYTAERAPESAQARFQVRDEGTRRRRGSAIDRAH